MREAQKKLAEAQRHDAVEKQEEAKRELELAKAELEAILRQLREEEVGRTLAMLEARFRKMLELQNQVNDGTKRLDQVPRDRARPRRRNRGRPAEPQGGRQSWPRPTRRWPCCTKKDRPSLFPKRSATCATTWSKSSCGWPRPRSDEITQGIEEDIIVALEEMIAALQKAQKDLRQEGQAQADPAGSHRGPLGRHLRRNQNDPLDANVGQQAHPALHRNDPRPNRPNRPN